jgi:hypothetical protein
MFERLSKLVAVAFMDRYSVEVPAMATGELADCVRAPSVTLMQVEMGE